MNRNLNKPEKKSIIPVLIGGHSLQIEQMPGVAIGSVVWESSIPICKYIEKNRHLIEGKRVIELGAGLGLVSIVCTLLGADVVSTDKKEVLSFIENNLKLNLNSNLLSKIKVEEFNWEENPSKLNPPFDVILASDVVYNEDAFEPLLNAFKNLTDSNSQILLAYKKRSEKEIEFFQKLKHDFDLEIAALPGFEESEGNLISTIIFRIKRKVIVLERTVVNLNNYLDYRNMAEVNRTALEKSAVWKLDKNDTKSKVMN